MKLRTASVLFVIIAITIIEAKKKHTKKNDWDELETLLKQVDKVGERLTGQDAEDDDSTVMLSKNENADETSTDPSKVSPCEKHVCGWGKECLLNDKGRPKCECVRKCPEILNAEPNDKVCSNHNYTFESICHLYRERCLCKRDDVACMDQKNKHLHLEYLGTCKDLEPCTQDHLDQFSDRMADWLFQVMKDLKKRKELHGDKWLQMFDDAEHDDHLKHVYPVIWKYCDLDSKPHDKAVTNQELIPIIAPVMPMESCIKPFLKSCDKDNNDNISLKEWGKCLGLKEEEITERC